MFKNKLLNIVFIMMIALTIIGVSALFAFNKFTAASDKGEKPNIDQIVEKLTVDTDEMTTNLLGNDFIKTQFKIQVSSEEAKEELEKRKFQIKNAIIYQLSGMKAESLQGPEGLEKLEASLKKRIDAFLKSGKVTRVYTTEKVIQ